MTATHLKAALALTAAILLTPPSAGAQTRELGASGELLDGIAALVDEGIVLRSEFTQRVATVTDNLLRALAQRPPEQRGALPPLSVIEQQVLEQLIIEQIQLQRAERFGLIVGDEMLNQAMASIAQGVGLTLEQFPQALAIEGIDYAQYREETRKTLVLEQLRQREVGASIVVAPRELDMCLTRSTSDLSGNQDYNVSHLLIGISSTATREEIEQARQRAEEVIRRLEAGERFADLAITWSEGQNALEGGALGWRTGDRLPTLFADIILAMEPGEHSEIIQSGSGFHIVRLNEVRGVEPVIVDQIRIRHILLRPNEIMDAPAVRQRLAGLRTEILEGDDFAAIARSVSEDTVSAADGGDLGWTQRGAFVPEFEQVINTLDIGELSLPFETRYGWHVAQIMETRSHDTTDELREQECVEQIRASKFEEAQQLWLRRLRDEAFVEIRL